MLEHIYRNLAKAVDHKIRFYKQSLPHNQPCSTSQPSTTLNFDCLSPHKGSHCHGRKCHCEEALIGSLKLPLNLPMIWRILWEFQIYSSLATLLLPKSMDEPSIPIFQETSRTCCQLFSKVSSLNEGPGSFGPVSLKSSEISFSISFSNFWIGKHISSILISPEMLMSPVCTLQSVGKNWDTVHLHIHNDKYKYIYIIYIYIYIYN